MINSKYLTKKELRKMALRSRRSMNHEQRVLESVIITNKLLLSEEFHKARTIFCYVAVEEEVHTADILQKVLATGKRLCVPYITDSKGGIMIAARLRSMSDLTEGTFGILTAPAYDGAIEEISPEDIDLVIVPGVAFSAEGQRIGMGGGYYDRFLGSVSGKSIGLAYECQLYDSLPVEQHDKRVDKVVISTTSLI